MERGASAARSPSPLDKGTSAGSGSPPLRTNLPFKALVWKGGFLGPRLGAFGAIHRSDRRQRRQTVKVMASYDSDDAAGSAQAYTIYQSGGEEPANAGDKKLRGREIVNTQDEKVAKNVGATRRQWWWLSAAGAAAAAGRLRARVAGALGGHGRRR